ncbi:MAG: restriction endonuclease subunit S, partial [Bacteroidales bacterium]|nr:restriction endonuclease subunit S [Bacteroidales bacterium]
SCKSTCWLGNYNVAVGAHTAIFHHYVNPMFLVYYFNTPCFYHQKTQYTHGSKVVEIKPSDIATCLLPLPPLAEQSRIVAKIEEVFAQIDNLRM